MSMIGAITGTLASRGVISYEYFTSTVYPFLTSDSLAMNMPIPNSTGSILWTNPNDNLAISVPTVLSVTLEDTIVYKTYNNGAIENVSISVPVVLSGTLEDTIIYIIYNNGAIENVSISVPEILSGTLE